MTKKSSVGKLQSQIVSFIKRVEKSGQDAPKFEELAAMTLTYMTLAAHQIKDLATALSKADRVNLVYKEMIDTVAVKNSGLRHKIRSLQRFISKLKSGEEPLDGAKSAEDGN